jgi:hypothetical protein
MSNESVGRVDKPKKDSAGISRIEVTMGRSYSLTGVQWLRDIG